MIIIQQHQSILINPGVSLAASEGDTVQPRCHDDDIAKTVIARNKTLVGGLEAGTFKFLGKVRYDCSLL